MATITISEALADIKTLNARLDKKEEFIAEHLMRAKEAKDPLEAQGGQVAAIVLQRTAMLALQQRIVTIRLAVQHANLTTPLTVLGVTKSMAEWLVWRRDVVPKERLFLTEIKQAVNRVRHDMLRTRSSREIVVNLDEQALSDAIEHLERTLGELDGQLSLKNATVMVEIPD